MRNLKLFIIVAVVFAADFASKTVVRSGSNARYNSGVSFGLLKGNFGNAILLLNFAVAALLCCLAIYFAKRQKMAVALGAAAMCGGSLGNLCDRLFFGQVTDWIRLPFSQIVFSDGLWLNIADFAIIAGFCLAMPAMCKSCTEK